MAPHVVNRPLALVRCPAGVGGQCFFQKHAAAGLISDRIKRIKDQEGEELIYIEDQGGLLTLVQAGVLEIHVWGSTVDDIERCNRIVFRPRSGGRREMGRREQGGARIARAPE